MHARTYAQLWVRVVMWPTTQVNEEEESSQVNLSSNFCGRFRSVMETDHV